MSPRKNKTFPERCKEVYDFFMNFYYENDMSPTIGEISDGTGIQRGNVHAIVEHLIEEGKIRRHPKLPRGLLPANVLGSLHLHWTGHITADSTNPIIVFDPQDSETIIEVPRHLLPQRFDANSLYVLQVKGTSMSEVNILDGDYVVMQSGESHRENDIVAVLLQEENALTLKMLAPTERGNILVKPKSHEHQNWVESPENVLVRGRVVAVMRKC